VNKKDVQMLHSKIKKNKQKVSAKKTDTLFKPSRKKSCPSCGKVTWKPNTKSQ
jgi:hypothetical protein